MAQNDTLSLQQVASPIWQKFVRIKLLFIDSIVEFRDENYKTIENYVQHKHTYNSALDFKLMPCKTIIQNQYISFFRSCYYMTTK